MRRLAKYLIALALLSAAGSAVAAPLDKGQADMVYQLAHAVSHLPYAETPPDVATAPRAVIEAKLVDIGVCPKGCPSVKAAQIEGLVLVDEALDFDDIKNVAVLVHEFVHFLQWAKDGEAQTCQQWVDREIIAYQMQNIVLNKANARMVQEPAWPDCSK